MWRFESSLWHLKENRTKVIVILGPTASGKSDLAVTLAKKFNGEVISADSRQVYKGLNIGTGKITKEEMRGVPHHLLDVADPKEQFTVSDFVKLTNGTIGPIVKSGKLPIICGGTGFYIDALLGDKQIPEVLPNLELRKELEQKTVEELFKILQKLDPERARDIDAKNPRRLIRAIEICKVLGRVPKLVDGSQQSVDRKYEVLKIGIAPLKEITHPLSATLGPSLKSREGQKYEIEEKELKERINRRIGKWFEEGLLEEVENLHKDGLSWDRMSEIGLEYKLVAQYYTTGKKPRGTLDTEYLKERMQIETHQYAKRQMTWFKKSKDVVWFDPKNIEDIEKEVENFLK